MIQKLPPIMMKIRMAANRMANRFSRGVDDQIQVQEIAQVNQNLDQGGDADDDQRELPRQRIGGDQRERNRG